MQTMKQAQSRFGVDALSLLRPEEGYIPLGGGLYVPDTGRYIPRIAGGARGYNMSRDTLRTLDGFTFPIVWTDLVNALAAYNRIKNEFLRNLCYQTTLTGVREISPGTMKFERGTEFGRPDRQRAHAYRTRGLPVFKYALGEGFTRDFLLNARQEEIDAQHTEAMRADAENLLYEIMTAAFNNTGYTYEDELAGPVSVVTLYNGDAEVPPSFEGTTFTAPHSHYHATAGATFAYADVLTMKNDLVEHGHDTNRILYIATDLENNVRSMTDTAGNPRVLPQPERSRLPRPTGGSGFHGDDISCKHGLHRRGGGLPHPRVAVDARGVRVRLLVLRGEQPTQSLRLPREGEQVAAWPATDSGSGTLPGRGLLLRAVVRDRRHQPFQWHGHVGDGRRRGERLRGTDTAERNVATSHAAFA
jgi:hypothetical protein